MAGYDEVVKGAETPGVFTLKTITTLYLPARAVLTRLSYRRDGDIFSE